MIHVKHLQKTFNKKNSKMKEIKAINKTTISFGDSGLVCILGASGSGKTTLLNVISGMDDFDSGQIVIDDYQLDKYSPTKYELLRASHFGFIFQNYLLLEENTVEDNIKLALKPFEISEAEMKERCSSVMDKLGILHLRSRLVSQLSGGQKQRVAIARVIVKGPKIIVADEPTGNLDEANTINVLNLLKELSKEHLILMVTHDQRAASCYADRIITIEKGNVISDIANESTNYSSYLEDSFICLENYEKQTLKGSGIDLSFYGTPEHEVQMRIVWTGSRYYIELLSADTQAVLLSKDSELRLVEQMPKPEEEEAKELVNYPPLTVSQRTNIQKVKKLANKMFAGLSKRYFYLKLVFIVVTLIISVTACVFFTVYRADKTTFITEDSHYVTVTLEWGQPNAVVYMQEQASELLKVLRANEYTIVPDGRYPFIIPPRLYPQIELSFSGKYFTQVRSYSNALKDYSIVPSELLEEEAILYGSSPNSAYDIVVDKWLADRIIEANDVVWGTYHSYDDLIGCNVAAQDLDTPLVITGICDTGEPSVYMDRYMLLYLVQWTTRFSYNDGTLREALGQIIHGNNDMKETFEEDYEEVLNNCLSEVGRFLVYTEDPDAVISLVNTFKEESQSEDIRIKAYSTAADQLRSHDAKFKTIVINVAISFFFIMILSILLFYFTMGAFLENRKRVILIHITQGILRKQILFAYLWSILQTATGVVLPTWIIFIFGENIASRLNVIKDTINYPWWVAFGVLVLVFLTAFLPAVVPVLRMLSKKPTDLGTVE
ncbi:ATP-binding cassette domain-containing protein [Mobilitalea sibirica]|uniref:ATP-binding cassette domain-containing protein n=1 Tax=Mobilitalea sibirica TaxID=1462919 RepID=A0A8J7HAX8_9FIRM|nr:ABC transporter ATP-binding protein [Mobilitalea sibirica]MBH1940436.1 ATP-binding cassette domain-containing protein [Mobilitalea sibirica]